MIQNPRCFVGKWQGFGAHFFNHANGVGRACVVHHGKAYLGHHQVAGFDARQAGMVCQ